MEAQLQSQLVKKNKAVVIRIAIAQLTVSVLVALLLLVLVSVEAAYSALLAGMISTLATLYTGKRFFSSKAISAQERIMALYVAEFVKLAFVTATFCASFVLIDIHFPAFVGAYLLTLVVYWLAMVWPVFGVQLKTNN